MGNRLGKGLHDTLLTFSGTGRGRKRKREEEEFDDSTRRTPPPGYGSSQSSEILHTPKRKRIQSTSKYIYQTLFLDGENSDISITALGRTWPLHKVYLSQSPYFACMFNGPWMESSQNLIDIEIQDPNVDEAALKVAFGSLYKDYIIIKPVQCVSVLAAATLLQLDGLIKQCISLMSDTIGSQTVCCYYRAGLRYGLESVKQECIDWLLINTLSTQNSELLKEISIDLMTRLIKSSKLFVIQVEMDIYTMLKKWMYLQLHQNWSGGTKDLMPDTDEYFNNKISELTGNRTFLETPEGCPYIPVFSCIRWQHIITDMSSLKLVEKDQIINLDWIRPIFESQWRHMIQLEQGFDKGPENGSYEDIFDKHCLRCGRVLTKEGEYCWRWIGYNFGLDLLLSYSNRLITIKRNIHSCPHSVSLQPHRNLLYRLTVASLDENLKQKQVKSSEITHVCLEQNEEVAAMTLDNKFTFPLHISLNTLVETPSDRNADFHQDILQRAYRFTRQEQYSQTENIVTNEMSVQTDFCKIQDILPVPTMPINTCKDELHDVCEIGEKNRPQTVTPNIPS